MTRREAVRVLLFERAALVGEDGAVRCAVVDLSALGALLTLVGRVPQPPLWLEFELGGEPLDLAVEIQRASPGERVAVEFVEPPVDQLHRLIAVEQRMALSVGRVNVRERRSPSSRPDPDAGRPDADRADSDAGRTDPDAGPDAGRTDPDAEQADPGVSGR
jgi:hypothetical protein